MPIEPKIYAILPQICATNLNRVEKQIKTLLKLGVQYFQYRNKKGAFHINLKYLKRIQSTIKTYSNTVLIVNDNLALMQASGADGLHIGQGDIPIGLARRAIGSQKILGVSCYNNLVRAQCAQRLGADYLSFGALFFSHTKPNATRCDRRLIARAKKCITQPIVVIGGIDLKQLLSLDRKLGVDYYAMSHSLFSSN